MPQKVYVKPPAPTRTILWAEIILSALFLPLGMVFVIIAEGEARPFAAIFALIWSAGCIALIVHGAKFLRLMKQGKIEIAELSGSSGKGESDFATRLRNLEVLKRDGLISDDEYQRKRAEIMQEKW